MFTVTGTLSVLNVLLQGCTLPTLSSPVFNFDIMQILEKFNSFDVQLILHYIYSTIHDWLIG